MAVVVITGALKDHVKNQITLLHQDKITEAKKSPSHWGDLVYNKMFSRDLQDKLDALPGGYVGTIDNISVRPISTTAVAVPYSFSCTLSKKMKVPNFAEATLHGLNGNWSSGSWATIDPAASRWDKFIETEYAPWCQNIRTLEFARDNDVAGAMSVLNAVRTLAPALKAWPALWELLPEGTKSKHKEVVERKSSARVIPSVDLDTLTGRLAAKRMGVK